MPLNDRATDAAPTRRRGPALEAALLDAAWQELIEKGYAGFTIESVAARAETSRAVIYRRWPGKPELAQAAAIRAAGKDRVTVPDTGSVRDDVIELLRRVNASRARFAIQFIGQLGGYFAETGTSPATLRDVFLSGRSLSVDAILARGVARGEVDAARLSPRVVGVAFDLYRQEVLMTLRPVPDDVIAAIVDEVFLPLITPR